MPSTVITNYDPHTYVTIGGTLTEESGQDEIWQIGIRGFDTAGGGTTPFSAAHLTQLADNLARTGANTVADWYASADAHNASQAHMRFIKAANIGADGKYTGAPEIRGMDVVGALGGQVPSFMSAALSFSTAVRFGKRLRHGRVYPPNYSFQPVSGSAQIPGSIVTSLATAGIALLNAVSITDPSWQFSAYIVSRQGGHAKITGVRVGNVFDVQRRRKNAVPETYTALPYP